MKGALRYYHTPQPIKIKRANNNTIIYNGPKLIVLMFIFVVEIIHN